MDKKYITMEEFLMNRDQAHPLSDEQTGNANTIVPRVNELLEAFGHYRAVTSGYRPAAINSKVKGAAKKSNHILCLACDLEDADGKLDDFCMANLVLLKKIGLWLEHPDDTKGWCHVQAISPKSGNRVFKP